MSAISTYLEDIQKHLAAGQATEHTYRPALERLINSFDKHIVATNEPKRVACGAPDYVVTHRQVPLGYVEAKDIGKSLDAIESDASRSKPKTHDGQQLKRYRASLNNLILTDYLEFRWYEGGECRLSARLGQVDSRGRIRSSGDGQDEFGRLFDEFLATSVPSINGPRELAKRMAALATIIRETIILVFQDEDKGGSLHDQLESFRQVLLHDLQPDQFADMYAQTICYGLFSARCSPSVTLPFSRQNAAYDLPKSNPFLRRMFGHIAGPDLEDRVTWAVDALAELLNRADIEGILTDFGKRTRREDPVVHFYETFLTAYDPKIRETRGVYYTPEPVVSYIVRSVDHILKTDFGLEEGLADRTKVSLDSRIKNDVKVESEHQSKECHRVLILDPAVGTGTFLHNVIDHIYESFRGNEGMWSSYVSDHLLPRLFGFELLMAPYAVAHMKLGLQLGETKYSFKADERLGVYLTNSLEKAFDLEGLPAFAKWVAEEANEAGRIKQDMPVMVVLGNPPYSGHSQTPSELTVTIGEGAHYYVEEQGVQVQKVATRSFKRKQKTFIGHLIQDYFRVDGKPLGERNPKWLNDDYVKFIRFAQWRIQQTGHGVLAFITNHGYLDNPTFRGMRQSLMNTFDDIYVLDLHGNSKKKEKCPDGSNDENVFDIQQGVAIGLFVKHARSERAAATVRHAHLWGRRESLPPADTGPVRASGGKYGWLAENAVNTTEWTTLQPKAPHYLFAPTDVRLLREYGLCASLKDIMPVESVGIVTARDRLTIRWSGEDVWGTIKEFSQLSPEDARNRFSLGTDAKEWKVSQAQKDIGDSGPDRSSVHCLLYRPFDVRFTYYTGTSRGFMCRPRSKVMRHMLSGENVGLIATRQTRDQWHVHCSTHIMGHKSLAAYDINSLFPLYLYPDPDDLFGSQEASGPSNGRKPNLSPEFVEAFSQKIGLAFVSDGKGDLNKTFGPEDIFAYAYAVFHAPSYRARYAEFLKTDFPRLPLTSNKVLFGRLCSLGSRLVALHTLQAQAEPISRFPVSGDNVVDKVRYSDTVTTGRVWINRTQYFEGVPEAVWGRMLGGYQVCQKWLKDRKGRQLSHDDLQHYTNIVSALFETDDLSNQIDCVVGEYGGWPIK